jgi:Xaa-Pro aminopeptidase
MYQVVLAAQELAVSMIKPNILCLDIQNAVEIFFKEQGYETYGTGTEFTYAEGFVHGVGHGVSKVLHDSPRIGRKSSDVLSVGDIVTIEPGLYYRNIGGIRIEDLFLVTEKGCEKISNFPYKFEI